MTTYIPYTYLIGWSNHNKWYYGVEFGWRSKTANPENLWKTYFTSSKKVKEFREKHGEPDIVEVRKTFTNAKEAKLWEEKVLVKMKVNENEKWLNIFSNTFKGVTDVNYEKAVKNWKKSISKEVFSERSKRIWKEHRNSYENSWKNDKRKQEVGQHMKSVRKSDPVLYCSICEKQIKGIGNWARHINGKMHKRNCENEKNTDNTIFNNFS